MNIAFIEVALVLLAVSGGAIAQAPSQPADCGVETARTQTDLLKAERFYEQFRAAIEHDQRKSVAGMVRFPLRVNGMNAIPSQAALLRLYNKVFDQKVRTAVRKQRTECLFGNWQGFMAGDGAVWFDYTAHDPKFKIIAVNNESWPSTPK